VDGWTAQNYSMMSAAHLQFLYVRDLFLGLNHVENKDSFITATRLAKQCAEAKWLADLFPSETALSRVEVMKVIRKKRARGRGELYFYNSFHQIFESSSSSDLRCLSLAAYLASPASPKFFEAAERGDCFARGW
jgi:hypothetical protein